MKTLLFFSGGIDSVWLLHKLLTTTKDEVTAVYVDPTYMDKHVGKYNLVQSIYTKQKVTKLIKWFKSNCRDFEFKIKIAKFLPEKFNMDNPYEPQYLAYLGSIYANEGIAGRVVTGNGPRTVDIKWNTADRNDSKQSQWVNVYKIFRENLNHNVSATYQQPIVEEYHANKMQRQIEIPSEINKDDMVLCVHAIQLENGTIDRCGMCYNECWSEYVYHCIENKLCEPKNWANWFAEDIDLDARVEFAFYVRGKEVNVSCTKKELIWGETRRESQFNDATTFSQRNAIDFDHVLLK